MLTMFELGETLPYLPGTSAPTIQHPLVYQASKGAQTHYLVGTMHDASLSHFPQACIDIFGKCSLLISEGLESISLEAVRGCGLYNESSSHNELIIKLKEFEVPFIDDIKLILSHFNLDCDLNKLSPLLIHQLWRSNKGDMLDNELVAFSRKLAMPMKSLNSTMDFLESVSTRVRMPYFPIELTLEDAAKEIANYYRDGKKLHPVVEKLRQDYLTTEIIDFVIPPRIKDMLESQNQDWFEKFMNAHSQGIDNVLMACGYAHFFGMNGLLAKFENEGFMLKRYNPDYGFSHLSSQSSLYFTSGLGVS